MFISSEKVKVMSINGVEELEYMDEQGEMEEGDFVVLEYPNGPTNGDEPDDDEYAQVPFFTFSFSFSITGTGSPTLN